MHKQFSKRVKTVVDLANTIAREYGLDYIGTEHILLAIRREGTGRGSKVLEEHGVSYERLKEEVDRLTKKSLGDSWVFGRLPGTPHFRNVVATALEQAERMGADEVATEHFLLALAKEEGSVAYHALKNLGCSFEAIHSAVVGDPSR